MAVFRPCVLRWSHVLIWRRTQIAARLADPRHDHEFNWIVKPVHERCMALIADRKRGVDGPGNSLGVLDVCLLVCLALAHKSASTSSGAPHS